MIAGEKMEILTLKGIPPLAIQVRAAPKGMDFGF